MNLLHPHGNRSRAHRIPVESALALLLTAVLLGWLPGQIRAQEESSGWEVRVILDGSRHETRRVRALFLREQTGPLKAPILGPGALNRLRGRDLVGDWPGFTPAGLREGPRAVAGLPDVVAPGARTTDRIDGVSFERTELPLLGGAEWRREGAEEVTWTVMFRDRGETLFSVASPFPLPLLPELLEVQNQSVLWTLHHGPSGEVDWALAIGLVGGSDAAYWEAFWRGTEPGSPTDLDQALDRAPWELMRHVLGEYRHRESWRPVAALKTTLLSARYNRVEGGSLEIPAWVDLTSTTRLRAWTRVSTSSYPPSGGVGFTVDSWPTRWGVNAFRKLQDANRWEPAETGRGNSLSALLHGEDAGHYFTATGVSLWGERQHGMTTWRLELFAESDRKALPRVGYSLLPRGSSEIGPGLEAEDGDYYGLRGVFEHQWGVALSDGVLLTRFWFTAAGGDRGFQNLGGTVDALRSRGWWAMGARVGGGRVFGNAPVQREFFLGGASTVRGFAPGTEEGPALAFGRVEMGFGPPVLRLVAFGDAGWAGEPGAVDGVASAGLGFSFAEGLFRVDFANPLSGGTGLRVYLAGNGLI